MNKIQFKAMLMTIAILGGAAYFIFGKPDFDISGKWDSLMAYLESDDKASKAKKKTKKYKSTGKVGIKVDTYNGVDIYDNGSVRNVSGRNLTPDGYNLGLKYQCVEFVKRFYYYYYDHKMPDSYGHARDFFNRSVSDGGYNTQRGLTQYSQGSSTKPKANDLIVFGPTPYNEFGHVAIISKVSNSQIEIAQQNPGRGNSSRATYALSNNGGRWSVENQYVMGWLRK